MAQMHKNMENSQGFSLENHVYTLLFTSSLKIISVTWGKRCRASDAGRRKKCSMQISKGANLLNKRVTGKRRGLEESTFLVRPWDCRAGWLYPCLEFLCDLLPKVDNLAKGKNRGMIYLTASVARKPL